MKKIIVKYKSIILYAIFGALTTVVNIIMYYLCARIGHLHTITSTAIAWIVSVAFAYVTNRKFVFQSNANNFKLVVKEMISFVTCRLLTGFMDMGVMYTCVDLIGMNDMVVKAVSNILVIVLNYVASKMVIFKENHI